MQPMRMETTEASSAAMPLKVGFAVRSSTRPESFGQQWQREIGASRPDLVAQRQSVNNAPSNTAAQTGSHNEPYTDRACALQSEAPAVQAAAEKMPKNTEQEPALGLDASVAPGPVPNITSMTKVQVDEEASGETNGSFLSASAGTARQAKATRPVQTSASAATIKGPKSQFETRPIDAGEAAAVASPVASIDTTANQVEATQRLAVEVPEATSTASTQMQIIKCDRSSMAAEIGGNAVPRPLATANKDVAAHAAKQTAESQPPESGAKTGAAQAAAAPGTSAFAGNQASDAGRTPAVGIHLNPAGAIPIAGEASAPGHTPASASRPEAPLTQPSSVAAYGAKGPQILSSGPAQLDIGVLDGTHGWLRIRAEMGGAGAVSASLTASASAHDSLRAALPEMARYLQSESVAVSTIAVHRAPEPASRASSATAERQPNGGAERDDPNRGEQRNDPGSTKKSSPAASGNGAVAASSSGGYSIGRYVSETASSDCITGLARGASQFAGPFGLPLTTTGGWLNVSA